MPITKDQIIDALRHVNDPELHRDIVTLNMVKNVAYCDGLVSVTVELTTPACPLKETIQKDVENALHQAFPGQIQKVAIEFTAQVKASPQQNAMANNPLPGVKHIIAVGAGKGGVGKSTISVNLAVGLARTGAKVGYLDGDIYGPSGPTLLGIGGMQPRGHEGRFVPFEVHGIKAMTIGVMVEPEKPLIWRGPMAHGAFRDLATRTEWGELDYLIIDLPPGTGDVPLTMSQILPLTGAVIVCTPQKVAQDDARRALRMFEQLQIPVLGVVENMSYFICEHGKEYDIFGRGGARRMAQEMNVPFLGEIPIHLALRENSDSGEPIENFNTKSTLAKALTDFVGATAGQISIRAMQAQEEKPALTVH